MIPAWLLPWIIILVAILVAGVIVYFIRTAPVTAEPYKQWAEWVVMLACAIFVIRQLWTLIT